MNACWSANLKEPDHSEDLDVDGKVTLESYLREIRWEVVDWIYLAHDKNQ